MQPSVCVVFLAFFKSKSVIDVVWDQIRRVELMNEDPPLLQLTLPWPFKLSSCKKPSEVPSVGQGRLFWASAAGACRLELGSKHLFTSRPVAVDDEQLKAQDET